MIIPKPIEFLCKYTGCPENKNGVCRCPNRNKDGSCNLCGGVERMKDEKKEYETDLTPEELEPIDGPICPYSKSICHTPYLDCYDDW